MALQVENGQPTWDPDEFVEEFCRRAVGFGKGCTPDGVAELLSNFRQLSEDTQQAIIHKFREIGLGTDKGGA
jgi:hypothetical protein